MTEEQAMDQNWQTGLTNVSKRISYLRSSPKWADLTINFPGHKKTIKAHKLLLAISSPVFEAMMFGPLAEGEVLSLPDDPPEAFEWLLDHLYCDQTKFPNMEMAIEVFQLAIKYQIQELCRICSEYLCQRVKANNLPLLYNMAYIFEDNTLLDHCEKILPTESDKVLHSNELPKLSRSGLKHLLENKNLKPSSGRVVFKCIHKWGKAEYGRLAATCSDVEGGLEAAGQNRKETDMAPLPHNLRQCVESLLPLVDLPTLSVDEFVKHVLPTGIFTPEENMSILQGLKGVSGTVLPSCVRPWALKYMVLVNRTVYYSACSKTSNLLLRFNTSQRIILYQIKAICVGCDPEGEMVIYSAENDVARGAWTKRCCTFQKPVDLEPGRDFIIKICKNITFKQWVPINVESGDIKITGEAPYSVEKLVFICYVFDK